MNKSFSKLLDDAYNLHCSGKLQEAKELYEKLLQLDNTNLDLLNLYAQLNLSLKNYDIALKIFKDIYEKTQIQELKINIAKIYIYKEEFKEAVNILDSIDNKNDEIYSLYGLASIQMNNWEKAKNSYLSISNLMQDSTNLYNLAICYKNLNNIDEAVKYAKRALEINKKDTTIYILCAELAEKTGDIKGAINYLINASKFIKTADLYNKLGDLYRINEENQEALDCFKTVLKIEPGNKTALLNIARLYSSIDKNISINMLKEVLKKYPDDLNIIFMLYKTYRQISDYKNSIKYAEILIEKVPNNYQYYYILADTYIQMYEFEKAIKQLKQALKLNPKLEELNIKYGQVLSACERTQEAKEIFSKYKDNPVAKREILIINLKEKNFELASKDFFEWHNALEDINVFENKSKQFFYKLNVNKEFNIVEDQFVKFRNNLLREEINQYTKYQSKLWNRQDITGKNILVYKMHGVGDFLMSVRYINELITTADNVILQTPNSLTALLKYNFPKAKIYSSNENINENEYDYTTSEMNLIYNLKKDFNNIEYSEPYLKVQDELVKEKSAIKEFDNQKIKVGLFWQGNPFILVNRSIPLEKLIPIFDIKNIQYYSFQISDTDEKSDKLKKNLPIIDLAPHIKNYSDTAALLKNIDLLITIDTSILHLAGALGVKTYLLLPHDSDWRWFYDTEKTDWYNSVKIFKQKKDMKWDDLVKKIYKELKNFC